jgi:CDP-glucose 4,6-dehydratase
VTVDRGFWRGKSVFVTGHTGFKGGWLTTWLTAMGASVCGYALAPATEPSYFARCRLERKVKSIIADVRDGAALAAAMSGAQPAIVFHLAAQPLVRRSYAQPVDTFATNLMGTLNFLEAVRASPSVKAAIIVTSDKCYENHETQRGYRETDPLGGHDPYSASKACVEVACASYRRSFFANGLSNVALATARAGNVIGGGDWSVDRIVPDAVRAFERDSPLIIRNPSSVRPWQHVFEPLAGYLMLAQRLYRDGASYAGAWNFGPADESAVSVATLADELIRSWGQGAEWRADPCRAGPHESQVLRLDCGKTHELLGWRPHLQLAQAVAMTVDWYRAAADSADMEVLSLAQIHSYEKLLKVARDEVY